ncbi:HAD-IB family phosphatase [Candidatus Woesearchaeota archaeon]|nr:HAD-IB family phosphatase [Candidatus Woesearchaeota archaeon]
MPIDLILLDMDGTIIQPDCTRLQSSWDMLGHATGRGEEWDALCNYYLPKPELHHEWSTKQFAFFKGLNVQELLDKILPLPYTPGFSEFCQYVTAQSIPIGIISSGLDLIAKKIIEEMSLNFFITNHIHREQDLFTGTGALLFHLHEKGQRINELLTRRNYNRNNVMFIGDHTNDISAWERVGFPLGINLKDKQCYPYVKEQFTNFYQITTYLKNILHAEQNQNSPIYLAVGAMLFEENILLLQHNYNGDYGNLYGLPEGKIEQQEHPSEAVISELKKRTGLTPFLKEYVGLVSEYLTEQDTITRHSLLHLFSLSTQNPAFKKKEGSIQWFALQELEHHRSEIIPRDYHIIKHMLLPKTSPSNYFNCRIEKNSTGSRLLNFTAL